MEYLHLYFLLLYLSIAPSMCIMSRIAHTPDLRRHIPPPHSADWELGLRESVHQALLRDHHTEPGLRDQLLEAPYIGRHNAATPFGDVAVLARGQLYLTPGGFKFLQDAENIDNTPYLGPHHRLLALWTVKRIRHRDPHYGHVFEIEYTISPITSAISEELVKRHGVFNYNVPGHVFVIKSDPRLNPNHLGREEWHKNYESEFREQFRPGILIGVTPDGYKHVLHSFPGLYSSYHPGNHADQTTVDPKEYELYKKLIESLASKTTHANVPHRFTVTTEKSTTSTQPTYLTTVLDFTQAQVIPLPTTQAVRFPTTTQQPTTKPVTTPVTTIHYYMPVEIPKPSTVTPKPTKKTTPFDEDYDIFAAVVTEPIRTTKPPIPEQEQTDAFPAVSSTEPMTPVTEIPNRTRPASVSGQLPLPQEVQTTKPYVSTTVPPVVLTQTTSRGTTTVLEQIPYTEEQIITTRRHKTPTRPTTGRTTATTGRTTATTSGTTATTSGTKATTSGTKATTGRTTTTTGRTTTTAGRTTTTTGRTSATTHRTKATTGRTTTVEQIPYTEEYETVLPTRRHKTTTATQFATTTEHKTVAPTTVQATTTPQVITSTRPEEISTLRGSTTEAFTIVAETIPSSRATTTHSKPNTIVEYSFDSTTKTQPTTELETTRTTLPSYFTTEKLPQTQTATYSIPTTMRYYYTSEVELPSTTTHSASTSTLYTTPNEYPQIGITIPVSETTLSYFTQTALPTTSAAQETTNKVEISTLATASTHVTATAHATETTAESEQPSTKLSTATEATSAGTTTSEQASTKSTTVDFLNGSVDRNRNKLPDKTDFSEDDIFGGPATKSRPETTSKRTYIQSDLENALFGERRSKQIKLSSKITRKPITSAPKIIYTNFYSASTSTSRDFDSTTDFAHTTATEQISTVPTTTDGISTTEIKPSTDQSYSTSISIQVNKKNGTKDLKIGTSESDLNGSSGEKNKTRDVTERNDNTETNKAFDDAALQLINHARSIDYMHKKQTRQAKYRRRNPNVKRRGQRRSKAGDKTEHNKKI